MKSSRITLLLLFLAACAGPPPPVVSVSSLDFGAVEPNQLHRGKLVVTNRGDAGTELIRIDRKSGPESLAIVPAKPGLEPGESSQWSVNFRPAALGVVEARFVAVFDTGSVPFTVRSLVAEPCAAEPFDVGDARVGASASRSFTFTNPLATPTQLTVPAPPAPFSAEPTGLLRLAAGETREVTLHFAPATAGVIEAPWKVATRTDCTPSTTTLRGRALEASLAFVPGRLHFGVLGAGTEAVRTVELENRTRAAVRVTDARFDAAGFTLVTPLPLELAAEGSVTLTIQARPSSGAQQSANLTLVTDAFGAAELTLPLLVNREAPCLSVSSPRLDFPAVEVACRTPGELLTLTNACPHVVHLAPLELSADFGLVSSSGVGSLAPGSSQQLSLLFFPRTHGVRTGSLRARADVLDGTEELQVELSGTATPITFVEETLDLLPLSLRQDVLLVIDDSPRMVPHQAHVARNLWMLGRYLDANLLDARVAVMSTSTTPGVVGHLRRTTTGASWLEKPTPEQLQAHGVVRGEGTGRSSCLEALKAAVASPLRDEPSELGAFLRPDTALQVVCITNGRDEFEGAPMEVLSMLQRKLPVRRQVTVVARFSEWASCGGTLDHGPLLALANSTLSGMTEEFCASTWPIEQGWRPIDHGYRVHFALRGVPSFFRGPLRVFIDDAEWPRDELNVSRQIWQWDSAQNAVVFEPLYAPPPGSRLTVRYTPDCPG